MLFNHALFTDVTRVPVIDLNA